MNDPIVAFDIPLEGATCSLAPLEAAIATCTADVVVLAEMNHFVHEKSDFRLWLLRALARRGVAVIAEELGWTDGLRVDEYLRGSADALARIATLGCTADRRTDRDHLPRGMLREAVEHYPTALFRAEQERFYRGLFALGISDLRYIGFDVEATRAALTSTSPERLRRSNLIQPWPQFKTTFAMSPRSQSIRNVHVLRALRLH